MKKFLLPMLAVVIFFTSVSNSFAQVVQSDVLKGIVVDALTKEPLPGASVAVKGTKNAVSTKVDGEFSLKVNGSAPSTLVITFIGFQAKEVTVPAFKGTKDLGAVTIEPDQSTMNEVVVTANIAIDRKTPVALSTVSASIIQEKASNQEFPELLKSTPGVYATKAGGGFGDSRINVRGFKNANVAVMINGIPVNDMENGSVYWSNWSGLTDVTSSMQVQRGLGASKVAVPSIGGTINIVTKGTDATKGGFLYSGIGNNGYSKLAASFSTGLTENGWAISAAGSKTEGNGWAEGLQFEGYNYFFNVSKLINKHHTLSLTGFGAPQRHGQRQNRQSINTFRNAPQGSKFNADWGYLNGQVVNVEDNFYHKPQFSLNHYWSINETSFLSTAAYVSMGSGGGGAYSGTLTRTGNEYSPFDLDAAVNANLGREDGSAGTYLRASRNDHKWYGVLSSFKKQISNNFDLLAGVDLRSYKGDHFTEVTDLLGADYVLDNTDVNHPNRQARVGDKITYHDNGYTLWQGGFLQGEYTTGPVAAFLSLAASNTSYKRIDYFRYLETDPLYETGYQHFFGYQVKGGLNYNINEHHNIYGNAGYFEKAPFFNAVFINNQNVPNPDAKNEKIQSFELGYGYRSSKFSANFNVYHTTWMDRSLTKSFTGNEPNTLFFANLTGVDARHKGVELDFSYRPITKLTVKAMASVGDWKWLNDLERVTIFDENQVEQGTIGPVYSAGLKVGDAAQTTVAVGLDYTLLEGLKVGLDYNFYDDLFGDFIPTDVTVKGLSPWKVPSYNLLDLNGNYKFKLANLNASIYANVNNIFNIEYISDANANFDPATGASNAGNSSVFFGTGRTWTTGLKVNF